MFGVMAEAACSPPTRPERYRRGDAPGAGRRFEQQRAVGIEPANRPGELGLR